MGGIGFWDLGASGEGDVWTESWEMASILIGKKGEIGHSSRWKQ